MNSSSGDVRKLSSPRGSGGIVFDTSVVVFLTRGRAPDAARPLIETAIQAIDQGAAVVPAVSHIELLVGARDHEQLRLRLADLPVVDAYREVAEYAGTMGRYSREQGHSMRVPDLLIAATAAFLEIPLLHWDRDYARSRALAESGGSDHPGAELWRRLRLHPASLAA